MDKYQIMRKIDMEKSLNDVGNKYSSHVEIVSHLVNTCSRQVDLDLRNNLGFTPLMKAALQGRTKIAKILLFADGKLISVEVESD
ncbi:hypothetical protein Anas_08963 [Armadillidium nasatum]|uniref:Uncharacterized protein n=1 Tax=Armadillidium nasatum TaxID=96803 RepID=A0A5N5T0I9_9CRUS|nr:hypothetical protein Anas_08963 [Armadillidium nasatum]